MTFLLWSPCLFPNQNLNGYLYLFADNQHLFTTFLQCSHFPKQNSMPTILGGGNGRHCPRVESYPLQGANPVSAQISNLSKQTNWRGNHQFLEKKAARRKRESKNSIRCLQQWTFLARRMLIFKTWKRSPC